ncbi:MAG: nitrilase-related carbon-nitrogen hydrolase [Fimbriimonadaceae bacterium]
MIAINLIVMLMVYRQEDDHKRYGRQTLWMTLAVFGLMLSNLPRVMGSPPTEPFRVTLGQVGVDMAFTEPNEEARQLAEATADIVPSADASDADLLVLPEGFAGVQSALPPATYLGPEPAVPVIMGGQWKEGDEFYQSALLWDGTQWHHADKTRLVVFGEYVPFRKYLPFLKNFNLGDGDLSPAKQVTTLKTDGAKFGCLICFEGVFADIPEKHQANGANLLVQMSIDDWYIDTPAFEQLWGSTVWRSIESGMPVVRVGALGQTLATDAQGNIIYKAPLRERRADTVEVELPDSPDGFRYRSWFGWIALVLSLVLAFVPAQGRKTSTE